MVNSMKSSADNCDHKLNQWRFPHLTDLVFYFFSKMIHNKIWRNEFNRFSTIYRLLHLCKSVIYHELNRRFLFLLYGKCIKIFKSGNGIENAKKDTEMLGMLALLLNV